MSRLTNFGTRTSMLVQSIRFRITLWFTAILALILAVFSGFVYYNQSRDISNDDLSRLERKMVALEATIAISSSGIAIPNGILQDTDVLVLLGSGGEVVATKGPLGAEEIIQLAIRAQQGRSRYSGPRMGLGVNKSGENLGRANYIFVMTPIVFGLGQAGYLLLGSLADPFGLSNRLVFTLAAGSLLTLTVALVGGFWLADRAMRPVKTITQTAHTISETDLSRRLNLKGKDELGELANTFDAMLARLQAAFERQRQFVADTSHALRTPLTVVNLETSRALASRRSIEEYQQALTVIHGENDFMASLVNDLLMLARMDAGQTVMEKKALDLSDIALETIERLAPLASRIGVTLEAGDLPEVHLLGDRKYLLHMVSNLVENGIKYTSGENRWVRIETGITDREAWVRVSDNGPGIPAEHLPHLFDRFYQVEKAPSRNSGTNQQTPPGSGLGLSIVKWIAQAHGGQVGVESKPGVGTTFEVTFRNV